MAFYAGFIDLQAGPTGSINIRSGGMGDVIIGAGILGTGPWPPPNPPPMPGSIIKVTAEGGIILACGQNTITLDTEGVTIDALMITLKAKAQFEIDTLKQIVYGNHQQACLDHAPNHLGARSVWREN